MLFRIAKVFIITFLLNLYINACSCKYKIDFEDVKKFLKERDTDFISTIKNCIIHKRGPCRDEALSSKTFVILTDVYIKAFINEHNNTKNGDKINCSDTSVSILEENLLSELKKIDVDSNLITCKAFYNYTKSSTKPKFLRFKLYVIIKSKYSSILTGVNSDWKLYSNEDIKKLITDLEMKNNTSN